MKRPPPPEERLTDRVDTLEIRARLCKLVGNDRAELYFRSLGRFMGCQLGKEELDRTCLALLGHDNIHLHNALIKSIYSNACTAAAPPPPPPAPALTTTTRNAQATTTANGTTLNNAGGAVAAASHRMKRRRRSTRPVTTTTTSRLAAPLGKSPLGQPAGEFVSSTTGSSKRPREVVISVENDDEVDEARGSSPSTVCVQSGSPTIGAPSTTTTGAVVPATVHHQNNPSSSTPCSWNASCYSDGELPDSQALSRLLEDRLKDNGGLLTSPGESADILNSGLNAYITQMLETCLGVAKARGDKASCRMRRPPPPPNCGSAAAVNSGGQRHHAGSPAAEAGCRRRSYQASLLDVWAAAVQSNGRLVGFTMQHEKITSHLRSR